MSLTTIFKKRNILIITALGTAALLVLPAHVSGKKKKKPGPYDAYNHEMHNSIFESVKVPCETCHADPDSYTDKKKVNPLGCHTCHNSPNPTIPANKDCNLCHSGGFPKPQNHKANWISKHQTYAKLNPKDCVQCHPNQMFCIDCHQRRDTVQERMHRRNFKFYHSIEARANPRKCSTCHTTTYCQQCHAGKGNSSK